VLRSRLASRAVTLSLAVVAASCGETNIAQLAGPGDTPCTVSANAPLQPLSAEGDRVTVSAAASRDCLWTASSQSSWLQVSPANGQGDGTVVIVAAANASTDLRIGAILINDVRLTLTQAASAPSPTMSSPAPAPEPGQPSVSTPAPSPTPASTPACTFNVTPRSASFGADGGAGALDVSSTSGCAWAVTSSPGWIDITSGERGHGSGLVRYQLDRHKGKGTRTGTIVVAGISVTITQIGDKD